MNTKQAEERTGISRQNIRYYERMGLLHPARDAANTYRDYSEGDVEILLLIKMLRLLDMPVEEIASVIQGDISLAQAVNRQQERLLKQQKRMEAAAQMCGKIQKNEKSRKKDNTPDMVARYLKEMEYIEEKSGGFAQIRDDYKKVAMAAEQKQFSFIVNKPIHSDNEMWNEIEEYAEDTGIKVKRRKGSGPLSFSLKGGKEIEYEASFFRVKGQEKNRLVSTVIICTLKNQDALQDMGIPAARRKVMQGIYSILRNIRRQKWKSILNILICTVIVCFAAFYAGNVENYKNQLQNLPNVFTVTGEIWNLSGKNNSGLLIPEERVRAIEESSYIKDYHENVELAGTSSDGELKINMLGINCFPAAGEVKDTEVEWAEGMDEAQFFDSTNVCIAGEEFLKKHQLAVGDVLPVEVSCFVPRTSEFTSLLLSPLADREITIAGSMRLTVSDMLLPLKDTKEWFRQQGTEYNASALSFTVARPLELNEFKKEMKEALLLSTISRAFVTYKGEALVIDDATFIESAQNLKRSIRFLSGFYPFITVLILLAGYIVSYLLLQSRRMELAIMRTLGSGKRRMMTQIFMEHLILAAAGSICGLSIGFMCGLGSLRTMWKVVGLFLVCYSAGALVSLWMAGRFSMIAVLTGKE